MEEGSHDVLPAFSSRPMRCYRVRTALYRVPADFKVILDVVHGAFTTFLLRLRGPLNVCTDFSRRSHHASTAFWHCADELLAKQSVTIIMLKKSSCLQPWPDLKYSTSLRPLPSAYCPELGGQLSNILHLLHLHLYKW